MNLFTTIKRRLKYKIKRIIYASEIDCILKCINAYKELASFNSKYLIERSTITFCHEVNKNSSISVWTDGPRICSSIHR